jgi:MFS family permease
MGLAKRLRVREATARRASTRRSPNLLASAILPFSMVANPLEFLVSSSSRERRALAASTLGWMLDGMDVTLYAMVLRELLHELRLTTAQAGLLASVTLMASAAGGILFGFLADRFGRRPALIGSIVVYSVFTAACGFSHGVWELAAWRLGVGLGMGGEWATGAALVSETWPDQHRGKALGIMQSGFAIGYALAALIAAIIMPRWGWRPVFFAGILPALITLWIGARVEESPLWLSLGKRDKGFGTRGSGSGKQVSGPETRGSGSGIWDSRSGTRNLESGIWNSEAATNRAIQSGGDINSNLANPDFQTDPEARVPNPVSLIPHPVSRPYAKVILVTLLMNSAALFGWWGLFTWIPSYLALPVASGGRGLSLAASSAWIIAMQAGMWLGYVTFGFISDLAGRKRTYIFYLFAAALLVPLYARAQPLALLVIGPLLAFFGTGHFTGFGVITAELFPTSFRATAMGLTYNFGRALSAAAPWTIGVVAAHGGLASAFGVSGVAFVLAGILAFALPETRGRSVA